MKRYRFTLTFLASVLLHSLLLVFLIQSNHQGFKKGVGDDQKIKISSFEFASYDSKAQTPPTNPLPQSIQKEKKSAQKRQKPKKLTSTNQKQTLSQQEDLQEKQGQDEGQKESPDTEKDETQTEGATQDEITQPAPQVPIEQTLSYQLADAQTKKIISEFYGAEFGQLGTQEQEYILNNLAYIGRITQSYLRYPPNAGMLAQSGGNVVEFYLHPNGDISDLKIIKKSGFILLDRNSIKTIEIAYKDYPRPNTKTLIRFYINYYLVRH